MMMVDDVELVDDYLANWDRFAQGRNELAPYLRDNRESFEAALARLLWENEATAAARLVFYSVVQVGGFIALESELGRAATALLGPSVPVFTSRNGSRSYFAGDLYFWWETNSAKFSPYPLLNEWLSRDFGARVVAKYRATREQA